MLDSYESSVELGTVECGLICTKLSVVTISLFAAYLRSSTRGHNFKLYKPHVQTTLHKHYFSLSVINNWNSLPYEVVNTISLDSFKSKLNNTWEDKIYVF